MKRRQVLKKTVQLVGATALGPSLFSLLQSCKETPRLAWQPVFLNIDQANFISVLVDTLLPKTDTPGALDVKVDMFIDLVFGNMYDNKAQTEVLAEIDKFNSKCMETYGNKFTDLAPDERVAIMKKAEQENAKFNKGVWGTGVGEQAPVGFYRSVKSLAMWGYFSSEEVGKNILNYDPVPGEYNGCIPLSEVGKIWSL